LKSYVNEKVVEPRLTDVGSRYTDQATPSTRKGWH
jgi:hypothetical protein